MICREVITANVGYQKEFLGTGNIQIYFYTVSWSLTGNQFACKNRLMCIDGLFIPRVEQCKVFILATWDISNPGNQTVFGTEELTIVCTVLIYSENFVVREQRERK